MKVVVFGASGTAGSAVLDACLADPRIDEVVSIGRRPCGRQGADKLKEIQHANFLDFTALAGELGSVGACFFCLGAAQGQVPDEATYVRITQKFPLAAAEALQTYSPLHTFHFLSGQGADPSGKSRVLFARVKGETEVMLTALGLERLLIWRPGYIHPLTAGQTEQPLSYRVMGSLFPLLRGLKGLANTNVQLGRAMVEATFDEGRNPTERPRLREPRDPGHRGRGRGAGPPVTCAVAGPTGWPTSTKGAWAEAAPVGERGRRTGGRSTTCERP